MNLRRVPGSLHKLVFRMQRATMSVIPGGRMSSFGSGEGKIGSILVVNLDRQPRRWRQVLRELGRFRTCEGAPLTSITRRLPAVDARDGRAVAATADVDPVYRMGNQLFVQPDRRLEECFGLDEPVRMTRQEVAVARSHIEVWKVVATGSHPFVLVLEDDVWFRRGAAQAIDRGWRAALRRHHSGGRPSFLYVSYADAGGTAERADVCDALFRPLRGLWFLSGYVLSRDGAATLLRAMPVVGPVDTWINYRFEELGALALSTPAILQRADGGSDNSYSVLPYLARAGIVDAGSGPTFPKWERAGPVIAWSPAGSREPVPMALSMLGLRVRVFEGGGKMLSATDLRRLLDTFDALVDAPLGPDALSAAIAMRDMKFILDCGSVPRTWPSSILPDCRTTVLSEDEGHVGSWQPLCALLGLPAPAQPFPAGAPRNARLFRDDRPVLLPPCASLRDDREPMDDSPWVLPPGSEWRPSHPSLRPLPAAGECLAHASLTGPTLLFPRRVETFPGNMASFVREGLVYDDLGARLIATDAANGSKPYRSGAFASSCSFEHGRFEAEIKAARGAGLVTGFFLHRDAPRQEIDIELLGNDSRRMLVNVFFNPGDEGATLEYGYRGSPHRVDLGFDSTSDFHLYAIDWGPGHIAWSVDGRIVHERVGWDPTPLPHLPMRLHGNLWIPRSRELAGALDQDTLPATAVFRNISVWRCFRLH